MNYLTPDEFSALKPAGKRQYLSNLHKHFVNANLQARVNSPRQHQTQGYAFLWVSLYGKDSLSRAFVKYLNENDRLFKNYRGSKNAWFFGSQSKLGAYDGLTEMVKAMNSANIPSLLCDEWD